MKQELEEQLGVEFPKIFKNLPYIETDDGWFELIRELCTTIQSHIDYTQKYFELNSEYNKALVKSLTEGPEHLARYYNKLSNATPEYVIKWAQEEYDKKRFKDLIPPCPQVTAVQVKEKFGILTFYYDGGDNAVNAAVDAARQRSTTICEFCGEPGILYYKGWIKTLCKTHAKEFDYI